MKAYVMINTKPGISESVVRRALRSRGVKMVNSVFGRYDAVLVIEAIDREELSKVLYEVSRKSPRRSAPKTRSASSTRRRKSAAR